LNFSS